MDTNATSPDGPSRSRRYVVKAAAGAVAGLAAATVVGTDRASASDGEPVILGQTNFTDSMMSIYRITSSASDGITIFSSAATATLYSQRSENGGAAISAVHSNPNGVTIQATTWGDSTSIAVQGDVSLDVNGSGGTGIGVHGKAKNGIGIRAECIGGGYALQVLGRAVFQRSGQVVLSAGQTTKVVSGRSLIPASLVLATVQGGPTGVMVEGVTLDVAHSRFTIRLNRAAPSKLTVGWFIVN